MKTILSIATISVLSAPAFSLTFKSGSLLHPAMLADVESQVPEVLVQTSSPTYDHLDHYDPHVYVPDYIRYDEAKYTPYIPKHKIYYPKGPFYCDNHYCVDPPGDCSRPNHIKYDKNGGYCPKGKKYDPAEYSTKYNKFAKYDFSSYYDASYKKERY